MKTTRWWWMTIGGAFVLINLLIFSYGHFRKPGLFVTFPIQRIDPDSPAVPHAISSYPTPTPFTDPRLESLNQALQDAVAEHPDVLAYLAYQVRLHRADFTADGRLALLWLELVDRDSQEALAGEAGLAIAQQTQDGWKVLLQSDPEWLEQINQVPETLLPDELKKRYQPGEQSIAKEHLVFSGYKLPWEAGVARRVSGSIGHVFLYKTCPATCLYAFDFADGTMFPVLAAKGGRVKYAVWKYPTNNHKNANFLILEDTTTFPTTYQVYYHLAQDSIPQPLRTPGAEVQQGQFIGIADNTGPSTGHHLHFMVHTNPSSFWGTSVDITFDDVSINGGRPRTCSEAKLLPNYGAQCQPGNWLISGNGDHERPTGGIDQPTQQSTITTRQVTLRGWSKDDGKIALIQPMITWDGTWQPVGDPINPPGDHFQTKIDLCKAHVPDGLFFLALQLTDDSGKTSEGPVGTTALVKQFACNPSSTLTPTPVPSPTSTSTPVRCQPKRDQAGLFTGVNFTGRCKLLKIGEYHQLDQFEKIGDDNVESIKVGEDVLVLLFSEANLKGQREVLLQDDPDLGDNPIGSNQVSSLVVRQRPPEPEPPQALAAMRNPITGEFELSWKNGGAATEYRCELHGPDGFLQTRDWGKTTLWKLPSLPFGAYTWVVWARNLVGEKQARLDFTVEKPDLPPVTHLEMLPPALQTTAILLQWKVDDDSKDIQGFQVQFRYGEGEWEDWAQTLSGDQRQAWFIGKAGQVYQFRLRAIDSSGNAESFPEQPEVSVQLAGECHPDRYEVQGDSEIEQAIPLEVNHAQEHNLCGGGDVDWIVFPARVGRTYQIRTEPLGGGAAVTIQLYSGDGSQLLGKQAPSDLNQPAYLNWIAPEDGIYAVRLSGLQGDLVGTEVRYKVQVSEIANPNAPAVLCSSLLLPLAWGLFKAYQQIRRQRDQRRRV